MGGLLLGWRTVCAVEIDAYCRSVLLARQRDGMLQPFPIWDDVCTFAGKPWRGHVDVVSGGFPCQDISSAGGRAGITGERSGLWSQFARIIGEVRPRHVLVENSPDLTARGLGVVLGDLAALGYDARWDVLGARHVGAPHKRDRIWIVATDADRSGERAQSEHAEVAGAPEPSPASRDAYGERIGCAQHESPQRASDPRPSAHAVRERTHGLQPRRRGQERPAQREGSPDVEQDGCPSTRGVEWWKLHRFAGVDDGLASRVDRVSATGNGQGPAVVRLAWETLA